MASIFSKIVAGEIPCHKIAETEDYLAFLEGTMCTRLVVVFASLTHWVLRKIVMFLK